MLGESFLVPFLVYMCNQLFMQLLPLKVRCERDATLA